MKRGRFFLIRMISPTPNGKGPYILIVVVALILGIAVCGGAHFTGGQLLTEAILLFLIIGTLAQLLGGG